MRKYLLAGLAVALLLGGVLFALLRPWHCPVNRAAFERIEEGMTKAEVEKILGGPPGDYRTDQEPAFEKGWDNPIAINMMTVYEWDGDEIIILAWSGHSPDATVNVKEAHEQTEPRPGLLERARFRLNRLKARLFP